MAGSPPTVSLGSVKVPALAYGSGTAWFNKDANAPADPALVTCVASAINLGFRHIDAAEVYNTETEVGAGIKAAGVAREELFITTKVYGGLSDPVQALRDSLSRLGLSHVDLFLVHAPFSFKTPDELVAAWKAMEACVDLGLSRMIGVSNFRVSDIETLIGSARIRPVVNQVEFHPYLQQPELVKCCKDNNIVIATYGGLAPILGAAGGPLDPVLDDVSARLGRTKGQVLQRWAIQKGCLVVTTTAKPERMQEYLDVQSFSVSAEDMDRIDQYGAKQCYRKFWAEAYAQANL